MHRRSPFLSLAVGFATACGCSTVLRDPGRTAMLSSASGLADEAPDDDRGSRSEAGPVTRWAEGQRFIFERAWREIREDLAYDRIDSFANLEGPARRDVLAMRDDMASDRGTVTTTARRRAAREE